LPEQLSGAHTVPTLYLRQPPLPSQRPSVPHVVAPWSVQTPFVSTEPAASGVQWPIVEASAQLRQAPLHAPSQHTPSTHMPERHSASPAQVTPRFFLPHWPATQAWPLSQSLSVVQDCVQAPVVHRYGEQFCTPWGRQAPRPSHVPGVLRRVPVHEAAMQIVSAAYFSQPPKPSHVPVVPQLAAPWSTHWPRGSAAPVSMGQQVPLRSGSAHETQPPPQATLQHTPSAQKPDAHSPPFVQFAPFIFIPQLPETHCWPFAHSVVWVHASKQAPFAGSHE
jgi:hypothetical protein